jgi:hypothetical protein
VSRAKSLLASLALVGAMALISFEFIAERRRLIFAFLVGIVIGLLAGCSTVVDRVVPVNVAVPVPCQQVEPVRPVMDTETLSLDAAVDVQARAMRAEIERREGYEGELRTALRACLADKPM